MSIDRLVLAFDNSLRALCLPAVPARPMPGDDIPEAHLESAARRHSAALMRVNHVGEICAQALYQGQSIVSSSRRIRQELEQAAREEVDHLAWTESRIAALGGRKSLLNPLWYGGALTIGVFAGLAGDRWNLGFLAETERQVEAHLDRHLRLLPMPDLKSRAVLEQMKSDERAHAETALHLGAAELPAVAKAAMRAASRVMTATAYYL